MRTFLFSAATLSLAIGQAAMAQGAIDCQTITNDVLVTDAHEPMPQGAADGSGLGSRSSGQVLARWATVQDRDPEACVVLKQVQQRLRTEENVAAKQCPDALPVVRQGMEAANSEAAVMCGRR